MAPRALAFANNDIAIAAWKYDDKIPNCLGFAVYRIDLRSGVKTPLPAWVGFKDDINPEWKASTTEKWPVQKFVWRDLKAWRGGFYKYQIIPMIGAPHALQPLNNMSVETNPVTLNANCGNVSAFFNRGILSTQSLAFYVPRGPSGKPNYKKLVDRIDQPGDPLRNKLSGELRFALMSLLNRAKKEGGQCYCALYEFTDPELENMVIGFSFAHIILSNACEDDKQNMATRQALHESHIDITDRMLSGNHIGHNKFVVYVDHDDNAKAVLTGSTNWTPSALCRQTNNALLIESQAIATFYYEYWKRLKADQAEQSTQFRSDNNKALNAKINGNTSQVTIWFSPNTAQKNKSSNSATPKDMQEIFDIISGAKQAVMFLLFQPGEPSIIGEASKAQKIDPDILVKGAITDPESRNQWDRVDLYHRTADMPDASVIDTSVISVAAVEDEFSFWRKELLKTSPYAHAVIHDKLIVIDPFSEDCVVVTGSHNLGNKASYSNDENLVIIKGNKLLAEAYLTHVIDVYDHYRWRFLLQQKHEAAFKNLDDTTSWQDKYFKPGSAAKREVDFWMSAIPMT